MDLIINNYKEIIALIGSLTGLLGLIATVYYKYRDSNIKDKELELKKIQFELDKQHKIRRDSYQKIFEQKIILYKNLNSIFIEHKKNLHNVGIEVHLGYDHSEFIRKESISISTFKKIIEMIEKNIFFVSEELEVEFVKIKDLHGKYLYGFNSDRLLGVYKDEEIEECVLDSENEKFFKKYKKDILTFFDLIEKEINKMKQEIGLI